MPHLGVSSLGARQRLVVQSRVMLIEYLGGLPLNRRRAVSCRRRRRTEECVMDHCRWSGTLVIWAVTAGLFSSACDGGDEPTPSGHDDGGGGGAEASQDACPDARVVHDVSDCREVGHECGETFTCTPTYDLNLWDCTPFDLGHGCDPGMCSAGGLCVKREGGNLCDRASDCCDGTRCVGGHCTAVQ